MIDRDSLSGFLVLRCQEAVPHACTFPGDPQHESCGLGWPRRVYEARCTSLALQCATEPLLRCLVLSPALWVAGDTAKPRLGLLKGVYMALCASVDTIIHNEALTDYSLSYRKLFRPNVLGTVNIIRLALTLRAKAVTFISRCAALLALTMLEFRPQF